MTGVIVGVRAFYGLTLACQAALWRSADNVGLGGRELAAGRDGGVDGARSAGRAAVEGHDPGLTSSGEQN